jgi:hypothetical protein
VGLFADAFVEVGATTSKDDTNKQSTADEKAPALLVLNGVTKGFPRYSDEGDGNKEPEPELVLQIQESLGYNTRRSSNEGGKRAGRERS